MGLATFLARAIYQAYLNTDSKMMEAILGRLRTRLLKVCNPLITCTFRGFTFTMPFSHTIFIYQKHYPLYDMQLHWLSLYIKSHFNSFACVDVGANIGDTVCFSGIDNGEYLCIEGEKAYAQLIKHNIAQNFSKETTRGGAA